MIVTIPPSKEVRSSSSAEAVSEKNLKETASFVLARWKTTAYKISTVTRKLAEVLIEMEAATTLRTEKDFTPQKTNARRETISGQKWEVEIG